MKFINLSSEKQKTPFRTILEYGCGPNYILNRKQDFRLMVEDQGKIFWFRFWLTFCLHPEDLEITEMINDCMPGVLEIVNEIIGEKFVEAMVQEACDYAFEKIISPMIPCEQPNDLQVTKNVKPPVCKCSTRKIIDVMEKCGFLAFGCALCQVFYKWSIGKDADVRTDGNYWTIPAQYLQPKFKPGPLEIYMAYTWHYQLPSLLGVSLKDLPWLKKLLHMQKRGRLKFTSCEDKECFDTSLYKRTAADWEEDMTLLKNNIVSIDEKVKFTTPKQARGIKTHKRRRFKINNNITNQFILELPIENSLSPVENDPNEMDVESIQNGMINVAPTITYDILSERYPPEVNRENNRENNIVKWKKEKCRVTSNSTKTLRHCAYCLKKETDRKQFKKCALCVKEKVKSPNYYCSIVCQTQDWFRRHDVEHQKNCGITDYTNINRKEETCLFRSINPIESFNEQIKKARCSI